VGVDLNALADKINQEIDSVTEKNETSKFTHHQYEGMDTKEFMTLWNQSEFASNYLLDRNVIFGLVYDFWLSARKQTACDINYFLNKKGR